MRCLFPRAAAAAGGFLLFLILSELLFGNWIFGPRYGFLNLPYSVQHTIDTSRIYEGSGETTYTRDGYGLRGGYESLDKIDLLAMGASTTNELYVDDADTWTAVISAEAAKDGRSLTVVNAGVDGHPSSANLRSFDVWFPKLPNLKPRFILFYVGLVDTEFTDGSDKWKWFRHNSVFYRLQRGIRGISEMGKTRKVHVGAPAPGGAWAPVTEFPDRAALRAELSEHLEGYAGNIGRLAERARRLGARPVFVSQTFATYRMRAGRVFGRVGADGEVIEGGYARTALFNETMLAACRRAGAVCIDLASELEFKDGDFYDFTHTTPQGSARIGRYLWGKLKDTL